MYVEYVEVTKLLLMEYRLLISYLLLSKWLLTNNAWTVNEFIMSHVFKAMNKLNLMFP